MLSSGNRSRTRQRKPRLAARRNSGGKSKKPDSGKYRVPQATSASRRPSGTATRARGVKGKTASQTKTHGGRAASSPARTQEHFSAAGTGTNLQIAASTERFVSPHTRISTSVLTKRAIRASVCNVNGNRGSFFVGTTTDSASAGFHESSGGSKAPMLSCSAYFSSRPALQDIQATSTKSKSTIASTIRRQA